MYHLEPGFQQDESTKEYRLLSFGQKVWYVKQSDSFSEGQKAVLILEITIENNYLVDH